METPFRLNGCGARKHKTAGVLKRAELLRVKPPNAGKDIEL